MYALPGVPLGAYTVRAEDFETGLTGQASGALANDGDIATTDVHLEPSGGIAGIVYAAGVLLDAQGQPIHPDGTPFPDAPVAAGVEVAIEGRGIELAVQTDALGSFATPTFLPVGDYALTARSLTSEDGATVSVRIGFDADVAFAALALRGVGSVEGVVLDSLGVAPVEGASVTLASESAFGGPQRSRITGPDGRFAFDGVAVGRFSITVRTTLQVPALGGAAQGELTAHEQALFFEDGDTDPEHEAMRLQEAGDIAFAVVLADGTTPAEGAVATLDGNGLRLSRVADAAGAIRFEGIPLGSYALQVREPVTNGVAAQTVVLDANGQQRELGTLVLDAGGPVVVATVPGASASGVDPAHADRGRVERADRPGVAQRGELRSARRGRAGRGLDRARRRRPHRDLHARRAAARSALRRRRRCAPIGSASRTRYSRRACAISPATRWPPTSRSRSPPATRRRPRWSRCRRRRTRSRSRRTP